MGVDFSCDVLILKRLFYSYLPIHVILCKPLKSNIAYFTTAIFIPGQPTGTKISAHDLIFSFLVSYYRDFQYKIFSFSGNSYTIVET